MEEVISAVVADEGFDKVITAVKTRFDMMVKDYGPALFTTATGNMFSTYLASIDEVYRQGYNCTECASFIKRYGNLVVIDEQGRQHSVMWDESLATPRWRETMRQLRRLTESARITGVFYSENETWGTPQTGDWYHLNVESPSVYASAVRSAGSARALSLQHFTTFNRALAEWSSDVTRTGLSLLEQGNLNQSELVIDAMKFLRAIQDKKLSATDKKAGDNLVWKAAAGAPAGWVTPRSGVIGSLLDDVKLGMSFDVLKRRFDDKMRPDKRMRPTAPVSAGNVTQANKLIEKLGLTRSLERRFAKLEEVKTTWTPKAPTPEASKKGIFDHLLHERDTEKFIPTIPPTKITWDKFARTVLPNAQQMHVLTIMKMNFTAIVTAVHTDAPPILQWDKEDNRNPFSWYMYSEGSMCHQWNLPQGDWIEVTAITLSPNQWGDTSGSANFAPAAILLLKGAVDKYNKSLGLFPNIMRGELHEVRSTIEHFSNNQKLEGVEEASACGVSVPSGDTFPCTIRVKTDNGYNFYTIDRWD